MPIESGIGKNAGIRLSDALDIWAGEARGSSARVFRCALHQNNGHLKTAAFKLMRPDKPEYAQPLFIEEADVLQRMADIDGVMRVIELGFVKLDNPQRLAPDKLLPDDMSREGGGHLTGTALRLTPEETPQYLTQVAQRVAQGWLPYLALQVKDQSDSLYLKADRGKTLGKYLPVVQALNCAQQICNILQIAHERGIVYRDHKILHYYWDDDVQRVSIIDWNIAKYMPNGLSPHDIQSDLIQFAARTLHYLFCGRPAPGALGLGPTRPEEIERDNAHRYQPKWEYDDKQRLPPDLLELLERALLGDYPSTQALGEDLQNIQLK